MTEERYLKISVWFRRRPGCLRTMAFLNRWLPLALYAAYPALILVLAFQRDARLWKTVLIPAAVFAVVTVIRKAINAPRPYEQLPIQPLIAKNKKGESFPSRHVASAVVLAEAFWYISPLLGIPAGLAALLMTVIRPLAGIHFPRDVIAGAVLSLALGIPAFLFLPF